MSTNESRRRVAAKVVVVVAAVLVLAAGCKFRGPAPTDVSIEAAVGPYAYESVAVGPGHGFGGGTIWHPVAEPGTRFGGVAVVPGYISAESTIAWYGPFLASNGFVVITITTNSLEDHPSERGEQLLAALDYLTVESSAAGMVNPDRLAVMGWSMGGGGALHAAKERPELRAAVPLAPFTSKKDWSGVTVPTLVVACGNDNIAPNTPHSKVFYESLPVGTSDGSKAYLEVAGGNHYCVTTQNTTIQRSVLPWLKRWVDGDTRYFPWLCPAPTPATFPAISEYRSNCPA